LSARIIRKSGTLEVPAAIREYRVGARASGLQ
jgi:hypothetical protein